MAVKSDALIFWVMIPYTAQPWGTVSHPLYPKVHVQNKVPIIGNMGYEIIF
jgi:hypothetical protein